MPSTHLPGNQGMFDPDSDIAGRIVGLWWLLVVLGSIAFAIFLWAMVVALWRRRAERDDVDQAASEPGSTTRSALAPASRRRWVLWGGVVLPVVMLTWVLVATVDVMRATPDTAPPDALRVEVVGHQWWYEVHYPDHDVTTANELWLPVGRTAAIELISADVIHSFWVPALGGKLDILPDGPNTFVTEPEERGEHYAPCAEFCGLLHARMSLQVHVVSQAEFASWVTERSAGAATVASSSDDTVARGADVFDAAGCARCHAVRGTGADGASGPDLTHVASRSRLAGTPLPMTAAHLRTWITDPDEIKDGVDMPATDLSEADLDALVAYLLALR
jgi:cytochrome c oxidase subunit 2